MTDQQTAAAPSAPAHDTPHPIDFEKVHHDLRKGLKRGHLATVAQRKSALRSLRDSIKRHEEELLRALAEDFGKPAFEAYTAEIGFCYQDIDHTLAHLSEWAAPKSAKVDWLLWPTKARTHWIPKGVVLVVAPWNYPVNLALAPLIAAVAAGCHVALKPAEDTPRTAEVIESVVYDAFSHEAVTVVQGAGSEVVPKLMDAGRFDHVFYTGSTTVGRVIGRRCGEELIPCTLELGGKSPAVVLADADLSVAADRIVWGKFLNAGQTCVAPDYVLVDRTVEGAFLRKLKEKIVAAFGEHPVESPDFARIINDKHFDRLAGLLPAAEVYHGGQTRASDRFVAPTVLTQVDPTGEIMQSEIFGPLLPVLAVDGLEEAKTIIANYPNPLAAYCFTSSDNSARRFVSEIQFGGGCINDTVIHLGIPSLPFGGVQQSGLGRYHADEGFKTFSNQKSIATTSTVINLPVRYAPYSKFLLWGVKRLLG